jgi:tetratricopeptide (TPR) repeat protein
MTRTTFVIAVALCLATISRADEKSPEKNRAAAGEAYREGQRQYELNDFSAALELFKRAYTLYDEPALLYNIAQCHRQLGDDEQAIKFYKSYLRKIPDAPNRDDVTRLLATLEKASSDKHVRDERQRAEAERLANQRAQAESAERAAHAAQLEAEAVSQRHQLERQEPAERPQPLYKRWWLWTSVGVVVAGAAVGVGVYYGTRPAPFNAALPAFQLGLVGR